MPDQRAGEIEVRQAVIHGVECHEAWRDYEDCPHEKEATDAA